MSIQTLVEKCPVKLGMQGVVVSEVQLALAKLGYPLKGSGYFGGATDVAVEDFQRKMGLNPDGDVGGVTGRAIDKALDLLAAGKVGTKQAIEIARPLWLTEALRRVGVKEAPGPVDNPVIIEWAKELGGDIAKSYTHDSIPWCALFIDSCLARVGCKTTGTLWALDYAKYGVKLQGPAVGAIGPMRRSGGGHVVLVVGRDRAGHIVCVGANQDDAVNLRSFPADRFEAFTWPKESPLPREIGFPLLPLVNSNGQISTKES